MTTRAIREGQNTPRKPRIPRNIAFELRKHTLKDRFYPPQLRGVTPRKPVELRGMRGIAKTRIGYPPQPQDPHRPWSANYLRGMRGMREIIRPYSRCRGLATRAKSAPRRGAA